MNSIHTIMKYPALKVFILFSLGILISEYFQPSFNLLFLIFAAFTLLAILSHFKSLRILDTIVYGSLVVVAGILLHTQNKSRESVFEKFDIDRNLVVIGEVSERPIVEKVNDKYRTEFELKVESVRLDDKFIEAGDKIIVRLKGIDTTLGYGNRYLLQGDWQRPLPARNPGGFDYKRYLSLRGIAGSLWVEKTDLILLDKNQGIAFDAKNIIGSIRDYIGASLDRLYYPPMSGFLAALILGDRRGLSKELIDKFSEIGVIHVLAVSGLHVGLIAYFIFVIFTVLRVDRIKSSILTSIVLVFYIFISGGRPSVTRAVIMTVIVMFAFVMQRKILFINSIAVAGLIILIFSPDSIFDVGFQLSFAATTGILLLFPPLWNWLSENFEFMKTRLVRPVVGLFLVSLCAQLATYPIIAYHFNRVSVIALLANIFVVPLIGFILALGLITVILTKPLFFLAELFALTNQLVIKLLFSIVDLFDYSPITTVEMSSPSIYSIGAFYILIFLGIRSISNSKLRKRFVYSALIISNLFIWTFVFSSTSDKLRITFLDIGQGDGTVIQFPTGEVMVVDAGLANPGWNMGERVIAPFLRYKGIEKIDFLMLSHPDNDHVGGLPALIENFRTENILDPSQPTKTGSYIQLLKYGQLNDIKYRKVERGDSLRIGDVTINFLHPTNQWISLNPEMENVNINNASIAFRLQYRNFVLLMTGDIEKEVEDELVQHYPEELSCNVLKVAHHGSTTSSTPAFCLKASPEVAVISVGAKNKYGHPDELVLNRLRRVGAKVYRTDWNGAVMVETDGGEYEVRTMMMGER